MNTIIEPFRNKTVEPICFTSQEERSRILKAAGFNLFQVHTEGVINDLLTDSGTAAMSSQHDCSQHLCINLISNSTTEVRTFR